MSLDTVAVTGGSGKIGQAFLSTIDDAVHTVTVNRGARETDAADAYVQADLTDPGDVYGALATADPDAVVHLGMVPTPTENPEHVVFESNAMSPYYVLEAAQALGVETAVMASSLSALGAGYETDPVRVEYLPIDEAHPLTPSTSYGMGKQALEGVGAGFGRRDRAPTTIASIRFPWVMTAAEQREHLLNADRTLAGLRETGQFHTARNMLFGYLHIEDAAAVLERAIRADYEGHEAFWAVAADTTAAEPTETLLAEVYPDAERRGTVTDHESLFDTSKAADLLDWQPTRSWRDLF